MKKDDIIGKKFGRLTVIEKVGTTNQRSVFKCKCDCGNYTKVYRSYLISNITKSCGCLLKEQGEKLTENNKKFLKENTNLCLIKNRKKECNKNNKSGIRGVYKRENGTWLAQITFQRKTYNLGTYEKKEDAIKARKDAEKKRDEYLKSKGLID